MADFIEEEDLRILILEDVPSDAALEECELRNAGLVFTLLRVDTRDAFEQALDEFKPNVVLADYRLPGYSGRDALEYTRRTHPQIPVVMATGALGDEAAVELLKLGAKDYVLKDRLARLAPAVKRAMSEERGIRNRKIAEGKYKALFSEAMDGILLIDCKIWQVADCNPEFEKQTGRTLEQLKELKVWEILPPVQHELARQTLLEIQKAGSGRGSDFVIQKPGGEIVSIEFSAKLLDIQRLSFIQCVTRDISERLRAERALRDSEDKFRSITASAQDAILMMDHEGKISCWNAAAEKIFGYEAQEALGRPLHDLLAPERFLDEHRKAFIHFQQTGEGPVVGKTLELAALRKDGTEFPIELSLSAMKRDGLWHALGIIRDITERKQAETILRQTTYALGERLKELACLYAVAKISTDTELTLEQILQHIVETIPPAFQYTEITCARIKQQDKLYVSHGFKETPWRLACAIAAESEQERGELEVFYLEERPLSDEGPFLKDEVTLVNTIAQTLGDLWQRYLDDMALNRAHRALKTLSAGNLALVRATNEDELLHAATSIIVEQGGYNMAAVYYAEDDPGKSIVPKAWAGIEDSYYSDQHLSWADAEQYQLPVIRAICSGTPQICHDIVSDPIFKPWLDAVLARGYKANIALPLSGGGRTFGAVSIYSSEADAFDEEEVGLLEELANDLAYGIITLRIRVEHEQHATILRQSLEQSIQTIADTVEARDPYTAGHQRRVAELATAIAREMGLPQEQIHGVHLAAIVHDLGKIHIPAEILSKPGKLNDIEYMLIKTHPQSGYDILKDVKFPWPIADIILQHHEKLDGSGYPQGLKGGQILLEARIVAVADVVEAMSSHRPYRPGLGIEAAMEEIERQRGVQYDSGAVDACIKLFHERGYMLST